MASSEEHDPLAAVEARQRRLNIKSTAQFGIALVVLVVIGVFVLQTRDALCSFRSDLAQRVIHDTAALKSSHDYVFARDKHTGKLLRPGPILGFPRATILADLKARKLAIDNQQKTLRSLNGLHC